MRKLIVFNSISLDGYFTDGHGAMDWAHSQDPEWNAFVANNAKGGGMLVLGRVTYDLMIQFWPTPLAAQIAPVVAERMNTMPKVVSVPIRRATRPSRPSKIMATNIARVARSKLPSMEATIA